MNYINQPLQKGSRIAVVAASSPFNKKEFLAGIEFLRSEGFEPVYTETVFKKNSFVAGTESERSHDLLSVITNDNIDAIFFARGGYGSVQILPLIDKEDLAPHLNGKILLGYSDITALFCSLYSKYQIPLFYGPNVTSAYFANPQIFHNIRQNAVYPLIINTQKLRGGDETVKAPIFGGCLSVISSLAGTPYIKPLDDHIFFIEDSLEPPYKIDRMLTQLLLSGVINGIKGIVVGSMEKCETSPCTWKDPVLRIADILDIPVVFGINIGHGGFDFVLPLGVEGEIDLKKKELRISSPFSEDKSSAG